MRKTVAFLVIVLLLMLAACGNDDAKEESNNSDSNTTQNESATAESSGNDYTVALVMKTLTNPFFIEMERGAREAEQDLGITLVVRTAAQETSIEQQIEIIEDLIEEGVDAIVIAPGDSEKLVPVLKRAQDAGIVIVNIDNRLDPETAESQGLVNVPFISVDNEQGGYLSAQHISNLLTEPSEVIILEGIQTAQNAEDRKNGALRAFGENENVEVVAMETANWKIDEAYEVTKSLFAEHPDVDAIFAANDMMALGAIQYLSESGRDDVLVAGYDALPEVAEALANGTLDVTIDQQAALQGSLGVQYAVQILNGEEVPAETIVDVLPVTAQSE